MPRIAHPDLLASCEVIAPLSYIPTSEAIVTIQCRPEHTPMRRTLTRNANLPGTDLGACGGAAGATRSRALVDLETMGDCNELR